MYSELTPVNKFWEPLQQVLLEFERRMPKKAPQLVGKILVRGRRYASPEWQDKPLTHLKIYDNRIPITDETDPIATLEFRDGAKGDEFILSARTIDNQRFRGSRRREKLSNKGESMVRHMLKYVQLYTRKEIYEDNEQYLHGAAQSWLQEHSEYVNKFSRWLPHDHREDFINEYVHLKQLGIPFISPLFQSLSTFDTDIYREHRRRGSTDLNVYHVKVIDKKVSVMEAVTNYYKNSLRINNDYYENVYESFDDLPENIAGEVAMLKMLDNKQRIAGVGARVSEDEYYVMKVLADTTNA